MRKKTGNKETAILEAAIKIFAENGFHNSKIQKIAEDANVATGSVYLYYKSKEAILEAIFEHLWKTLYLKLKSIVERTGISPIEKFDCLIDLLFDEFSENSALAVVFVNEMENVKLNSNCAFYQYYTGFMDIGEQIVAEGKDRNMFCQSIDVQVTRIFVFGGLQLLLRQWAKSPQKAYLNTIRDNVKNLIKHGLEI